MSYAFNVKDYGAEGDGVADDTEAIGEAILAAKDSANGVYAGNDVETAEAAGAIVFFPKGTYLTTAPIKVPPTITLQGEGTGTLIRSIFEAPYDEWNGAIEMEPDDNGSLFQAGVRDMSIATNMHCGITYDRTKERWPAKVLTYQNSAFTDKTSTNNQLFRGGAYDVLTGTGDYLYVGFTNKSDFIPNKGIEGAGGLFWTRMKQLGFADKWGSRLQLVWEYSASAPFGPVSTWQQFSPTSELGGGFWHYGHNGTYTPDFSAGWVAGTVSTSGSLFWIRISTTSTIDQKPIAHHVDQHLVFVDASVDRVGIGTSTPAQKLDVNGTLRVKSLVPFVFGVPLDENSEYHIDPTLGMFFTLTLSSSAGTITADAGINGQRIEMRIIQDGGGNTVTWGSVFQFGTDIPSPNLTTTDDKCDYVTCAFNSTNNKWHVVNIVRGFSV